MSVPEVSTREHLTALIGALDRHITAEFEALRRETLATKEATDLALELQSAELSRRLSELNNESARLQDAVSKNVSADTWHAFEEQYKRDAGTDSARMRALEKFQARLAGAMVLATFLVPGVTAFIVYLLTRTSTPVG